MTDMNDNTNTLVSLLNDPNATGTPVYENNSQDDPFEDYIEEIPYQQTPQSFPQQSQQPQQFAQQQQLPQQPPITQQPQQPAPQKPAPVQQQQPPQQPPANKLPRQNIKGNAKSYANAGPSAPPAVTPGTIKKIASSVPGSSFGSMPQASPGPSPASGSGSVLPPSGLPAKPPSKWIGNQYSNPSTPYDLAIDPSSDGFIKFSGSIVLTEMNRDKASVLQAWIRKNSNFDKTMSLSVGVNLRVAIVKGTTLNFVYFSKITDPIAALGSYLNVLEANYANYGKDEKINYQVLRKSILTYFEPIINKEIEAFEATAPALGGGAVSLNEDEKAKLTRAVLGSSRLKLYILMYYGSGKIFDCVKPLYNATVLRYMNANMKDKKRKLGFLRTDMAGLLELETEAARAWPLLLTQSWKSVDQIIDQVDLKGVAVEMLSGNKYNQVLVPCSALLLKVILDNNLPLELVTKELPAPDAKKVGRYVRVLGEQVFMAYMTKVITGNMFLPLTNANLSNLWFGHCRFWSITRSNNTSSGLTSNSYSDTNAVIKSIEAKLNFGSSKGTLVRYK